MPAPVVSIAQMEALVHASTSAGVDVAPILARHGIDLEPGAPAISLMQLVRVERDVARALDDLTAHLSERKLTYSSGSFILGQMRDAATLAAAIESLAAYFNMLHGERYNSVRETGRTLSLMIDDRGFPYTVKSDSEMVRFVGECVLIKVHCLLDSLSDGLAGRALRRVGLPRAKEEGEQGHLRFWPVPLAHARPVYELVYDIDLARAPIQVPAEVDLSSDGIFNRVIDYLERGQAGAASESYVERTRDLLEAGCHQQDAVAQRLSVSVATLRRRLLDEGTSFRTLLEDTRQKTAKALLAQGLTVAATADALAYSDIRAFIRAFKRWEGVTPSRYVREGVATGEAAARGA